MRLHLVYMRTMGGEWVRWDVATHTVSRHLKRLFKRAVRFYRLPRGWERR